MNEIIYYIIYMYMYLYVCIYIYLYICIVMWNSECTDIWAEPCENPVSGIFWPMWHFCICQLRNTQRAHSPNFMAVSSVTFELQLFSYRMLLVKMNPFWISSSFSSFEAWFKTKPCMNVKISYNVMFMIQLIKIYIFAGSWTTCSVECLLNRTGMPTKIKK